MSQNSARLDRAPRQLRSEMTRVALMRAAERLFAKNGPENVTVRAIVEAAGQKNESALQYHFGSRQGLVREIHKFWSETTDKRRADLLAETGVPKTLRDIVIMMFSPSYSLAKEDPAYRRYVRAFGPETAMSELPAISRIPARRGVHKLVEMLQEVLPHLCETTLNQRIDWAIRLASISLSQLATQKNAFKGTNAQLAYLRTIDAMVGILNADVSKEAQALEKAIR